MQKKIRFWFTLVEMLIVMVIIGILSTALLPKLTGYLAKTRDLKRQADLRSIWAAIQLYKDTHGKFPILGDKNWPFLDLNFRYAGPANALEHQIWSYIKEIPTDPQKNTVEALITHTRWGTHRNIYKKAMKPGQYLYQVARRNRNQREIEFAILAAKVETPDAANFIALNLWETTTKHCWTEKGILWGSRWRVEHLPEVTPAWIVNQCLQFCDSVTKGTKAEMKKESDWKISCTYADPAQLHYIVKIE